MGKVIASVARTRALLTGRGSAGADALRLSTSAKRKAVALLRARAAIDSEMPAPALNGLVIQFARIAVLLGLTAEFRPAAVSASAPGSALARPHTITEAKHVRRTVSKPSGSIGCAERELICEPGQGQAFQPAPAQLGRAAGGCAHSTGRKASPRSTTAAQILPVAGKSLAAANPRHNWPEWRQWQQVTATGPLSAGPKVDRLPRAGKIVPTPRVAAGNCVCA